MKQRSVCDEILPGVVPAGCLVLVRVMESVLHADWSETAEGDIVCYNRFQVCSLPLRLDPAFLSEHIGSHLTKTAYHIRSAAVSGACCCRAASYGIHDTNSGLVKI